MKIFLLLGLLVSLNSFATLSGGSGGGGGGPLTFPINAPTGVLADPPSYGFSGGDADTGAFSTGDGNFSIQANGQLKASFDQNTIDLYSVSGVTVHNDLDVTGNFTAANFPPTGTNSTPAWFDGAGVLQSLPNYSVNAFGAVGSNLTYEPNAGTGGYNVHETYFTLDPQANTPNESVNLFNFNYNIDPNSTGFTLGTAGSLGNILNLGFNHQGTSNIGTPAYINMNSDIGNGTDAITMNGFSYTYGFLNIDDNVTVSNMIQGYGFQPNMAENSIMNSGVNAFYDAANLQTAVAGYTSFQVGPVIEEIKNNSNYNAININADIPTFTGNAGATLVALGGNYGSFDTGGFNGVLFNPTVTNAGGAYGLYVSMDNITVFAGTQSSLVFQDLTLEFNQPGDNNAYTLEYTPGATAGAEVVSIIGQDVTVQIETGVSTATQVKAALEANPGFAANLTATISGVGGNAQVTAGPTSFSGGAYPGAKKAAYLDGDVEITGSLSFGGALSIGTLTAYGVLPAVLDGGGQPTTVNSLVSSITIPANATTANADTIGLNTAALIGVGANSNITFGPFGLFTSLALPTVIETHTGSNLPRVQGGVFALSFGGTSTGGTVNEAAAGRFVMIPNGITTIDEAIGVLIDNPFGNPGTVNFGVKQTGAERNFFEGTLETELGVQLKTSGSKPTCDSSKRGTIWNTEGGAGVADVAEICQKNAADAYVWIAI